MKTSRLVRVLMVSSIFAAFSAFATEPCQSVGGTGINQAKDVVVTPVPAQHTDGVVPAAGARVVAPVIKK